jgi:hypothetical protein
VNDDSSFYRLRRDNALIFSSIFDTCLGGYFLISAFGYLPSIFDLPLWILGLLGLVFFSSGVVVGIWAWRDRQISRPGEE